MFGKTLTIPLSFCALLACMGCTVGRPVLRAADYVPAELDGWRAEGQDRTYDRESLFDYIDGAAEPYLHYGFRRVAVRRFVREGQPAVVVDLFDMGTSQDAFGIFSFEREGDDVGVGQGSEYEAGLMRFWKGRFFVSISADQESPASKAMMLRLGSAIDRAMPETGPEPDLLARLPGDGLIQKRVRYFRYQALLNYHYYVADANILHLGERTEAVLAPYATAQGNMRLLLVRYPTVAEAESALSEFLQAYAPEADGAGAAKTENGKWTVAQRLGALIAIVFDAPSREQALSLIGSVRAKEGREAS